MSRSRSEETLDVLREIWQATGQRAEDIEAACGPQRSCKSMSAVGFDGMIGPDEDLHRAWRAKLQREGKLRPGTGSVRELVLGADDAAG